jgi:hypothetical protein
MIEHIEYENISSAREAHFLNGLNMTFNEKIHSISARDLLQGKTMLSTDESYLHYQSLIDSFR